MVPGIPLNIEAWKQGYWTERTGNIFERVRLGLPLESFVIYNRPAEDGIAAEDRISHEMAHLVCCQDSEIFDPCWGVPEFFIDSNSSPLSESSHRKEIEVVTVEEIISCYLRGPEFWDYYNYRKINPIDIEMMIWDIGVLPRKRVRNLVKHFISKWDIEKIWVELNRKYRLVDQHLLKG